MRAVFSSSPSLPYRPQPFMELGTHSTNRALNKRADTVSSCFARRGDDYVFSLLYPRCNIRWISLNTGDLCKNENTKCRLHAAEFAVSTKFSFRIAYTKTQLIFGFRVFRHFTIWNDYNANFSPLLKDYLGNKDITQQ